MRIPLSALLALSATAAAEPPNILWIVADDLSPDLGCYGDPRARCPRIDALAAEGIRFTRAFATAPVCSSSRSAFITGVTQTTLGAHHHRTWAKPQPPDGVRPLPDLMREAGYFVCSGKGTPKSPRGKEDYNLQLPNRIYDGTDWSQRRPGQPFFAQVQIFEPHRAFVATDDPGDDVTVPPYLPDHPIVRRDIAAYYATAEVLDRKVGQVLDRLDAEGLATNTWVMFFGDHGRPQIRCKQWLYDGGIHVPLIVRGPGAAPAVDGRLISLIDLAPTTLGLAGLPVPDWMQGRDWNNRGAPWRDAVFAARDRCGDAVDRIRCLRTARWKLIHNQMPERPYTQMAGYKKLQYPVITLMRALHAQDRLGPVPGRFMAPRRPEFELYDLDNDPHEIVNLAADPAQAARLRALRQRLGQMLATYDGDSAQPEGDEAFMAKGMAAKRAYYEKAMRRRGLDPGIPDEDYLDWWAQRFGLPAGHRDIPAMFPWDQPDPCAAWSPLKWCYLTHSGMDNHPGPLLWRSHDLARFFPDPNGATFGWHMGRAPEAWECLGPIPTESGLRWASCLDVDPDSRELRYYYSRARDGEYAVTKRGIRVVRGTVSGAGIEWSAPQWLGTGNFDWGADLLRLPDGRTILYTSGGHGYELSSDGLSVVEGSHRANAWGRADLVSPRAFVRDDWIYLHAERGAPGDPRLVLMRSRDPFGPWETFDGDPVRPTPAWHSFRSPCIAPGWFHMIEAHREGVLGAQLLACRLDPQDGWPILVPVPTPLTATQTTGLDAPHWAFSARGENQRIDNFDLFRETIDDGLLLRRGREYLLPLCIRPQTFPCQAQVRVRPREDGRGGLCWYLRPDWFAAADFDGRQLRVRAAGMEAPVAPTALAANEVELRLEAAVDRLVFRARKPGDGAWIELAELTPPRIVDDPERPKIGLFSAAGDVEFRDFAH